MYVGLPDEPHPARVLHRGLTGPHRRPAVQDVAVIGLPDPERGERVCAVVEHPPGARVLTLPYVTDWLRAEGLSVHRLPEQVEVVDALPRNETLRKVLKYKLRERYS